MLSQDLSILKFVKESSDGSVSRERLLKAFKRSGATVGKHNGSPTIFFGTEAIPIGRGEIQMCTPHATFRGRLSNLAANVIKYNEIKAKNGLSEKTPIKRSAKPYKSLDLTRL